MWGISPRDLEERGPSTCCPSGRPRPGCRGPTRRATASITFPRNLPVPRKDTRWRSSPSAWATSSDAYDFILVFDADMRLPEGFFRDLRRAGRHRGLPAAGPARGRSRIRRAARRGTLPRPGARATTSRGTPKGLPVRLRGKAMGFSPRAFRLGPAAATRTTVEDSEATLAAPRAGIRVRALEAARRVRRARSAAAAMARSRARWFGGQLKLLFNGVRRSPRASRREVRRGRSSLHAISGSGRDCSSCLALAFLAVVSDVAMLLFSSSGAWRAARDVGAASGAIAAARSPRSWSPLLLSLEAKTALIFEWLSLAAVRRRIGYPPEVPAVTPRRPSFLARDVGARGWPRASCAVALASCAASGVKAVLLVPRLPGTGFTGDRLRAEIHLLALERGRLRDGARRRSRSAGCAAHAARRVCPSGSPRAFTQAAFALARAFVSGDPLQSALFSGDFRAALREVGRADLVVALLLATPPAACRRRAERGPARRGLRGRARRGRAAGRTE